ncbi:outer membrane protein assembly factor BamB family protein [Lentzea sp. NPDC055074]
MFSKRITRVTAILTALLVASVALPGSAASAGGASWTSWQKDLSGSRHNAAEWKITPRNVGDLKLKWAFAFPKVPVFTAHSQPAIAGGTMYFGGPEGKFYALDAKTGATKWTFELNTVAPGVGTAVVRNSPALADGRVYFGDYRGYLYALDQRTGRLLWSTRLDEHPSALITSSPIPFAGRLLVGTSSGDNVGGAEYACCTFRGHLDSIDAATGQVLWRYYTVPEPKAVGTWPSGATRYEPSGGGVWSSPTIDPATRTVFVGTGQNYTGTEGDTDSLVALDVFTGQVRWKRQMTHPDTWRVICVDPTAPPGFCPGMENGTALDWDLGAMPNIFTVNGRTLVGVGQKSGIYHVLDARSGEIVWQRQLSVPRPNDLGLGGILWGGSYDGERLYVATNQAGPGALHALDPATGALLWKTPNPADGCSWGGAAEHPDKCVMANLPAVTTTPGVVYEGSSDGKMRAYASRDGRVLWEYDTVRDFQGVNGITGRGSGLSGAGGAVVVDGMVYVHSGYRPYYPNDKGFVLLAFGR